MCLCNRSNEFLSVSTITTTLYLNFTLNRTVMNKAGTKFNPKFNDFYTT